MTLQAPNLNGCIQYKYTVTCTYKEWNGEQPAITTEHWSEMEHIEFWRFLSGLNGFAVSLTVEQLV